MKALILNSGKGQRLLPLTKDKPKALIEIGSKTLLEHQLDNLLSINISGIIITTGPFENKIKEHVRANYPGINVSYVNNPRYGNTNYIYSMWLARELIDDDVILLHGDLLFDRQLLERLINERYPNCVLVNREVEAPEKDFKAVIENDRVVKIGVGLRQRNAFFAAPLYKFSRSDFLCWLAAIDKRVKRGDLQIYAEDALAEIIAEVTLRPVYFVDEFCMEIDTEEDLEVARNRFGSKHSEMGPSELPAKREKSV